MKAIHFGAGKIGRGFIGAVLRKAGYDLTFVDVSKQLVDSINKEQRYTIHILDFDTYDETIDNIRAISTDSKELPALFDTADIVTTAVSMTALPQAAPLIAQGIRHRKKSLNNIPFNIISCENGIRATTQLKGYTYAFLDSAEKTWADSHVGFADSSVDRIIPISSFDHPLDVAVESFYEWNIDKTQIKGTLPPIPDIHLTNNLTAHIERKLFTVNTGHCAIAFLGNIKGCKYIHKCLADKEIKNTARNIMQQSGDALIAKFGFNRINHYKYIDVVLRRFTNPFIQDLTSRVGHDPRRKLSANMYFSYPISMASEYHLPTNYLSLAVAAGMKETIPGDSQCEEIHQLIKQKGITQAITDITSHTESRIIQEIINAYQSLNP